MGYQSKNTNLCIQTQTRKKFLGGFEASDEHHTTAWISKRENAQSVELVTHHPVTAR